MPLILPGQIDVPEGWSTSTSVELREPAREGLAVPLAGKGNTRRAGANIVVAREPAPNTTAAEALEAFVRDNGSSVESFKRLGDGSVTFADGREGASVTVAFSVGGYRAAQLHLFRVDGGVATHITVSVDQSSNARLAGELREVALSFRVRPGAVNGFTGFDPDSGVDSNPL